MLLIQGGLIKPVTGEDIPDGQILIDNGKILEIGKNMTVPEECEVFDASGMLVTPGLIDAHTHIGVHESAVRWEGADYNETSDPVTPEMRAIDGINPMDESLSLALAGGVTAAVTGPGSANVIGGTFLAMKLRGNCVDDMVIRNPVGMKAALGENPKGCYGQDGRKKPVTRMGIAALLRQTLTRARQYEKDRNNPSKGCPVDLQLEAMLPVISGEIPLKVHAHRADDILTALRIAKEFDINITLDHCMEGHLIVDQLLKAHRPVLVGPSFNSKTKFELKNKTFATPGILAKAGLEVCIITDAPVIPLEYLSLVAGLAVRYGMDEKDAWRAITINPAHVAGIDSRVGSLEPGKDADIAVFNGNPLREIQAVPVQVFVNGEGAL